MPVGLSGLRVLAPVQVGGSGGSASKLMGLFATAPRRADAEILMDAQFQGAHAPRADEEHIELEILPEASLPGLREPCQGRDRETQTCCVTLRCRGVTLPSSQRAEPRSTDKRDRKSYQ